MSKIIITRKSAPFEREVLTKALELYYKGDKEGVLFGSVSVFIDYAPKNAISVFPGREELEGKKIYVGKN